MPADEEEKERPAVGSAAAAVVESLQQHDLGWAVPPQTRILVEREQSPGNFRAGRRTRREPAPP